MSMANRGGVVATNQKAGSSNLSGRTKINITGEGYSQPFML